MNPPGFDAVSGLCRRIAGAKNEPRQMLREKGGMFTRAARNFEHRSSFGEASLQDAQDGIAISLCGRSEASVIDAQESEGTFWARKSITPRLKWSLRSPATMWPAPETSTNSA